jgi:hypothetical protein
MNVATCAVPARLVRSSLGISLVLLALLALAGCGSSHDAHDHAHEQDAFRIDTAGRLAIGEQGAPTLRLHDLDSGALESTLTLDHPASALYTSPGRRYVVAVQRAQDQVQFVDGGVWQEDHGDHLHDYKAASRLSSWKLTGPQPTHYDVQWGRQAAIFMDGRGTATPAQNAGVHLLTDASIARGATTARLELAIPIHGLAEPKDEVLLSVYRETDAADALPTHLTVYRRTGSAYAFDRRLDSRCNGMHGSGSSGAYTIVGCIDGVVAVTLGPEIADRKIATAARVGTIATHPAADGHFIGYGNSGTPSTTRLQAIDARNGVATEFTPQGWTPGTVLRAQAFERSGQRWFVIDSRLDNGPSSDEPAPWDAQRCAFSPDGGQWRSR